MSTAELPKVADDLLRFDDFCAMIHDGEKAVVTIKTPYKSVPSHRKTHTA